MNERKKLTTKKPLTQRNLVFILSAVVFAGAVLLSANTLFSVVEVQTDYDITTEYCFHEAEKTQAEIEKKYVGKNLLFLSEEQLTADYEEGNALTVTSIEKKFPNVLVVKVSERVELLAVQSGNTFYMMDGEGKFLRTALKNENVADKQPNFLLTGFETTTGDLSGNQNFAAAVEFCKRANELTKGLRSSLSSLEFVAPTSDIRTHELIVSTKEGVKLHIVNPTNAIGAKAAGVLSKYLELLPEDKLSGNVYAVDKVEGGVNFYYSK